MKNTKQCPKCNSNDIIRIDGELGYDGRGNNILLSKSIINHIFYDGVKVNRYICCCCGFTEEWIDLEDIEKLKKSKKAKRIG